MWTHNRNIHLKCNSPMNPHVRLLVHIGLSVGTCVASVYVVIIIYGRLHSHAPLTTTCYLLHLSKYLSMCFVCDFLLFAVVCTYLIGWGQYSPSNPLCPRTRPLCGPPRGRCSPSPPEHKQMIRLEHVSVIPFPLSNNGWLTDQPTNQLTVWKTHRKVT